MKLLSGATIKVEEELLHQIKKDIQNKYNLAEKDILHILKLFGVNIQIDVNYIKLELLLTQKKTIPEISCELKIKPKTIASMINAKEKLQKMYSTALGQYVEDVKNRRVSSSHRKSIVEKLREYGYDLVDNKYPPEEIFEKLSFDDLIYVGYSSTTIKRKFVKLRRPLPSSNFPSNAKKYEDKILNDYKNGVKILTIFKRYGVNSTDVSKIAKKYNVPMRKSSSFNFNDKQAVVNMKRKVQALLKDDVNVADIVSQCQISLSTFYKIKKMLGIANGVDRNRIIKMLNEGRHVNEIAKILNVSQFTITAIRKEFDIPSPKMSVRNKGPEIYQMLKDGYSIKSIMEIFSISSTSVYKIKNMYDNELKKVKFIGVNEGDLLFKFKTGKTVHQLSDEFMISTSEVRTIISKQIGLQPVNFEVYNEEYDLSTWTEFQISVLDMDMSDSELASFIKKSTGAVILKRKEKTIKK